jgi:hypothetical protein
MQTLRPLIGAIARSEHTEKRWRTADWLRMESELLQVLL